MNRLGRIFDNLIDIFIIGGKLGVEYLIEGVNALSFFWKEDHLTPPINDEVMWNGGGNKTHASGYIIEDLSDTPYDESNIIYDGVYEDGRINE